MRSVNWKFSKDFNKKRENLLQKKKNLENAGIQIGCLCKTGRVDFAWDTDFAHFLCVVRHSCIYTKTTIRLIGSLYFSEFYGN